LQHCQKQLLCVLTNRKAEDLMGALAVLETIEKHFKAGDEDEQRRGIYVLCLFRISSPDLYMPYQIASCL